MHKEISTINQLLQKSKSDPALLSPEHLLKSYLKTEDSHSSGCACDSCCENDINSDISLEEPEQDYSMPDLGDLPKQMTEFKETRDKFNQMETPDMNILNKYLPYRNAISNDPEKTKQYDDLIHKILAKASFKVSDEKFDKDTTLFDLEKTNPMDRFLSNLIAGSIVELYHNREDLIDKVLDRPEGFSLVALSREKDSGAVGLYSTSNNYMLLDGASEIMGLMNLKDKSNNVEQLNIVGHEFTHAIDSLISSDESSDNLEGESSDDSTANNSAISLGGFSATETSEDSNSLALSDSDTPIKKEKKHTADGLLPGMTEEDKQIIEAALNEIKTNDHNVEEYAQTDIQEFIATTLGETFVDNPAALKDGPPALQALYNMYTNYLKFDPLNPEKAFA